MKTLKEAAQQALEFLTLNLPPDLCVKASSIRTALRAALAAEGEVKPAATVQTIQGIRIGYLEVDVPDGTKLYTSPQPAEREQAAQQHPDDAAVDRFADAMKAKLAASRTKGRSGWDDPEQCSMQYLSDLLRGHVEKGDPVDVGNFAMMLHQRGSGILAALKPSQPQSEYPPLPEPAERFVWSESLGQWHRATTHYYETTHSDKFAFFTADQMRAYLDADRAQHHAVDLTDEQIEAVIRSVKTAGRSSGAMSYLRDIANAAIAADRTARGGDK